MSKERSTEIRERLFYVERHIAPLEWDASRKQINEFKKVELERLKVEKESLLQELKTLSTPLETSL